MLANERVTLNSLEESLTNIPLELNGVARGMGIQIAQQGSTWTPAATETPQLAQSVDTEGGLNIATTIGLRTSPVIKFGIVEPLDPAGTNWCLNPQCVSTGSSFTQVKVSGAASNQLIRDLIGFDYAELQVNPGTNSGEGLTAPAGTAPAASGSITAGVWLKGASGGEAVQLSLNATGSAATVNVTLTTAWQWFTVTQGSWSVTSPTFSVVGQGSVALAFYATGWCIVPGPSLMNGFDGTIAGCSWQGLPHASQSIRPAPGGARITAIMGDLEQQVKLLSLYGGTIRRMLPTQTSSTFRVTYDVINAQLSWDDTEYALSGVTQGTITFQCEPYGRGAEMTTETDSFNPLIAGNYVVDSGALSNFSWGVSGLYATANLSTENRFLYQGEYPLYSGEVQATFTPNTTITSFKGGCIIERQDAANYIEGYVTDNGSNSFLKVDKIVAGARTNEASATMSSRIASGTPYTVRIRTQRQNNADNVYAEYFANTSIVPTTGVPTTGTSVYAITDPVFGAETPGSGGIVFTPQHAAATCSNLTISPYLARERTLPVLRFGLAGVPGTVPGLGRMDISDCSNNNQLWATWGQRHDRLSYMASTTDLYYEAEALTPVNGAVVTGVSGASGGNVVNITTLPAGAWVSMLSTVITGVGTMTHMGSYNVWARCYATSGTPSFQLLWGVGSLSVPTANASASLPGNGAFYVLNLGVIQLTNPPEGSMQWFGAIQAQSSSGIGNAAIDAVWLEPLDDGAATMQYVPVSSSAAISTTLSPTTGTSVTGVGTIAWTNPNNVCLLDGQNASANLTTGQATQWLKGVGFGFGVPSGATITGIQMALYETTVGTNYSLAFTPKLVKAGTVQAGDHTLYSSGGPNINLYGGNGDLWGASWAYSDINNAQFGCAFSAMDVSSTSTVTQQVDYFAMTVYYTLGSGLTVAQDAVIYAGQAAEVGRSYAWRLGPAGVPWGPIGHYTGQYLKVPTPTAYDGFANMLVKASRNPTTGADSGIDAVQAQVSITPRYAQIPNS